MNQTATRVSDPKTGLTFIELSHNWGHGVPSYPGYEDVAITRSVKHAQHGVMSQRVRTTMHTGTHVNAPIHLVQSAVGIGELPLSTFFGPGVVVSIPKGEWEVVTAKDLESAPADIRTGDIVLIVTGWHKNYSDSQNYFAHGPGLDATAAHWLVNRKAQLVGVDTAYVDHPLATSLAEHRGGPLAPYLSPRYLRKTGRAAKADFPDWNPAHRILLEAGIPTIENVGGDVATLANRRATIHAMPWRWTGGDACPIRLMGLIDPTQTLRIEEGK